jgi:predicted TIM-barrel fold metal-dependent hydrolase
VIPKIDVHLHIDPDASDEALAILKEQNIAVGLNASGGEPGRGLEESVALAKRSQGRLLPLCNLRFSSIANQGFAEYARTALERCKALGGKGLKVSKYVGLGLTDAAGALVPVDDARLDIVFETAGALGLPVLIHSGDPKAFFEPNSPRNERYDELRAHPDWSFHGVAPNGQPWPNWASLLEQFETRVARHPGTTFMGAHFGNAAEEPERVARMLTRYPNYVIDTAARVPEFGRHPAERMRRFFIEFQDRVLFGQRPRRRPRRPHARFLGRAPGYARRVARVLQPALGLLRDSPACDAAPHPDSGTMDGRWHRLAARRAGKAVSPERSADIRHSATERVPITTLVR